MANTAKPSTSAQRIADAVKSLLPAGLHQPLRRVWRRIYSLAQDVPERWLYVRLWLYRLSGRSYLRWYADTLDGWVESRDPAFLARKRAVLETSGVEDLELLKSFGMRRDSTLHEFGCGQLRSALHFAEFLDPGKFSANDASKGRIDLGLDLFGDRLNPRNPKLIVNFDNSFDWLGGRKFDFLWCHAVVGHMPAEDVATTIGNVRKAMHAGSIFLFTHDEPRLQIPDTADEIVRVDARNWLQSFAYFQKLADKYGMVIEDVSSALKSYPSFRSHMCLAKMTLAASPR